VKPLARNGLYDIAEGEKNCLVFLVHPSEKAGGENWCWDDVRVLVSEEHTNWGGTGWLIGDESEEGRGSKNEKSKSIFDPKESGKPPPSGRGEKETRCMQEGKR